MFRDRSEAVFAAVPAAYLYPLVLVVLLVGTALALAWDRPLVGVAGVVVLSVLSLAYGAGQPSRDGF
ncbi:MAG: hypothetical protein ABEJ31_06385 [Haloarculaceae archaeon]